MTPRLVSCYALPRSGSEHWTRMARVLAHTAAAHCSDWDRRIEQYHPPPMTSITRREAHVANAQKQAYWCEAVEQAPDDTPIALMDTDVMILQPLDAVWDRPFDLAYTTRTGFDFPLNAGVIFLRVSPATRSFMRRWRDGTFTMLGVHNAETMRWRRRYGGVAQAAFGQLIQNPQIELRTLPCAEWNCEDSAWPTCDSARARIVHIKSSLRKAIFDPLHRPATKPYLRPLVARWRQCEQAAIQQAERTA